MTQPPDDAALVARIKASVTYGYMPMAVRRCMSEAATALEAQARRIAELSGLLKECADELEAEVNSRYHGIGNHPAILAKLARDLATVVSARAALEPSDKGVGR